LYYSPKIGSADSYKEYCNSLPQFSEPEFFGMHANAAITKEINETNDTLSSILSTMQSGGGGGASNMDTIATNLANSIIADIPAPFNVKAAEKRYPVSYEQSMNTVLTQELAKFNNLIRTINKSLKDMKRAIVGEILMS